MRQQQRGGQRRLALWLRWLVLALFASLGLPAFATCTGTSTTTGLSPSTVTLTPGLAVGTVLTSMTVTVNTNCDATGAPNGNGLGWLVYPGGTASGINPAYFATSWPGIGVRVRYNGTTLTPGNNCSGATVSRTGQSSVQFTLDFVKLSDQVSAGAYTGSPFAFDYVAEKGCTAVTHPANPFGTYSVGTLTIVSSGCNVSAGTANQTVTLPPVPASALPTVGATAGKKTFSLVLENCVANTRATMSITGGSAYGSGVLDQTGTAQGVGVYLLWNDTTVVLNQQVSLGSVGSSTGMSIPMTASYYRTGALTAGTVSAQAIITMSYQ
jgi:type 1 fimbria pilin